MTDLPVFAAAVLALLLTPGPTNVLLATSGTISGLGRSLPLLLAELLGYAVAICGWYMLTEFPVFGSDEAVAFLRLCAAIYLGFTAWRLWKMPASIRRESPVAFRTVLTATLLNPKAAIIGALLLPHGAAAGQPSFAAVHASVLAALIPSAGAPWIAAGALVRSGVGTLVKGSVVCRIGSVILVGYAGVLGFGGAIMAFNS